MRGCGALALLLLLTVNSAFGAALEAEDAAASLAEADEIEDAALDEDAALESALKAGEEDDDATVFQDDFAAEDDALNPLDSVDREKRQVHFHVHNPFGGLRRPGGGGRPRPGNRKNNRRRGRGG